MMLLVYAAGLVFFWCFASCHHFLLWLSPTYKSGLL